MPKKKRQRTEKERERSLQSDEAAIAQKEGFNINSETVSQPTLEGKDEKETQARRGDETNYERGSSDVERQGEERRKGRAHLDETAEKSEYSIANESYRETGEGTNRSPDEGRMNEFGGQAGTIEQNEETRRDETSSSDVREGFGVRDASERAESERKKRESRR